MYPINKTEKNVIYVDSAKAKFRPLGYKNNWIETIDRKYCAENKVIAALSYQQIKMVVALNGPESYYRRHNNELGYIELNKLDMIIEIIRLMNSTRIKIYNVSAVYDHHAERGVMFTYADIHGWFAFMTPDAAILKIIADAL